MPSRTDIANFSLAHLKQSKRIGNVDTEKSIEATLCLTFLDSTVEEVLRDWEWPVASGMGALALVSKVGDATHISNEWAFAYRYPNGCVNFRKIQSGYRVPTTGTAIPWRTASDAQGKLILTDQPNALGEWTKLLSDYSLMSADLAMAVSLKLATYIAPALTGSDPYKLGDKAEARYQAAVAKAAANAFNEQHRDPPADADGINARDGYPDPTGLPRAT